MKLIVGVTGASGMPLAQRLLEVLAEKKVEVHLIVSESAKKVMEFEETKLENLEKLAAEVHNEKDISASIASGSFKTDGMVVIPCSMKTIGGLASGYSDNLILRAGDVCLKQDRKLILVPRETPLSYIHLKNLTTLKQAGAVILPPVVAFYQKPRTLEDMTDFIIGKVLDSLEIEHKLYERWK
ncbi:MAG: UbiX family flavin prenyltransferase [archaeon]